MIDKWNLVKKDLPKESFMEVDLYQLIDDPETTLKNISGFIGVNYDKKMLNIDLSRSNRDRWEKTFTKKDNEIIDSILKNG